MAAAARREGSDGTLNDVRKQLTELTKQCYLPSKLEQNIVKFESQVESVGQKIELLSDPLSEPAMKAIKSKYRQLVRAVDAFRDYVQRGSEHEDHIHVMGRAAVGEFVEDALVDLIECIHKF